jgi:hypothetical protein
MKLKTIKYLGLGLAIAAGLATTAKADLAGVYRWVQDPTTPVSVPLGVTSSGMITVNGSGMITSGSWEATIPYSPGSEVDSISDAQWVAVTASGLSDGDAFLLGTFVGTQTFSIPPTVNPYIGSWNLGTPPGGSVGSADENVTMDSYTIYGNWVPVPEPTTMIAGALLLLPFGASTLRIVRKNRVA